MAVHSGGVNAAGPRHFRAGAAFSSFWPVNLQDAPFPLPRPLLAVGKDGAGNARDGQRVLGQGCARGQPPPGAHQAAGKGA